MGRRAFANTTSSSSQKSQPSIAAPMRRSSARLARSSSGVPFMQPDEQNTATMTTTSDKSNTKAAHRSTRTSLLRTVEVVVPLQTESPSLASSLSPSANVSSRGESLNDTPATSVTVTPGESDTNRDQPQKRISASTRAQQLRASALSLNFPKPTTGKKRSASHISNEGPSTELSDAALAQELQLQEYEGVESKRPRLFASGKQRASPIPDSDDDELAFESGEQLTSDSDIRLPNLRRHSRKSRLQASSAASNNMSLSDLDSTTANMVDAAEEYVYSSDDSLSDPPPSDTDNDRPISRRQRPATSGRRGVRAPRTAGTSLPFRMGRRAERERRKLENQHPSIVSMWKELEDKPPITPVQAEQPTSISRKLKSFQLEGLNWMMRQEQTQYKGGLLGDEMGMGKTIQAVSLLMSDYPVGKPSLVVVPPVALMQWQSEINEYTDGKLKVLVYHNSNPKIKHMEKKDIQRHDVIMISYSGLESMYRKELKGWNRDDGIVKEDSVIHSIHFHRLILDEAHSIKQRTTSVARACFALKSNYKWCLSGTPVQNRIGEFFSLLRFLEVRPFACYFCKMCKCQELHWSQDAEKKCTHCKHSGFSHVSVFNQEILNPITERNNGQARQDALKKLRLITDRIMLRRMKRDHTASMELPPKRVVIHNEFFGEIERDFSTSIMTNTTRQFDTYVSRGVMLNNYANIFGLIMQMRQVANHPDLILKKHAEGGQNVLVCSICDEPAESPIRSRCHHEFCRQCAKDYMRSFDIDSIVDCPRCHIPLSIDLEQPEIEQEEDIVKKNSIINRIRMENWTSSTKIEMLVYDLYKFRSKKQTHKSIVFSQFTSMLQLVEWRLRRAGFNTVMLDGSMTPTQRQNSIDYFMKNVDVEVFLVSLKAGGVALNLTEASRVFIVDPWWNPAAEWQSADRCHRIGQRRPCVITRLCIEDSVESRMVLLQEKKANMINGTINKDQGEALEKLTPEDMQFLFRGS
ncbi:putative DNA excision repair protein Rad16 [Talaromyces proteolyticus]|uniref:DNA excision repair protein Rad16 n=1 Tax=Talaromyces proteolyticus TaxID=1131652 RepID=A0AAD4KS72_9EURO|nr:putative DNA excision repair protein Rad16 [Talaromyces proteolyticus]KAH8698266.1 putative DNA excision repair protein Rad16 [Talaromyces proteolyticus]